MSRWTCVKCSKSLSSKRSFMEHLNTHNDLRPFTCDHCEYAAASQMTLRRHKLRNHVSRTYWGYSCPHCLEIFMEPASYQTHVSSRHPGLSATFGCTYCQFTTKSSKHFREHISKHFHVVARHSGTPPVDSLKMNIVEYLIDDESGRGYNVHYPCKEGEDPDFLIVGPLFEDDYKPPLELRACKSQLPDRPSNSSKQPTAERGQMIRSSALLHARDQRPSPPDRGYRLELDESFHNSNFETRLMSEFEFADGSWIEENEVAADELKSLPPLRSDMQDIDLD